MLSESVRESFMLPDNWSNPLSGQLEPNLIKLGEKHKYLVEGNYKIIYKRVKEGVLITDVFDTRQDPRKIQRRSSKPSR